MGKLIEVFTPLHKKTSRDYLARMNDDKVHCMLKAKEYEEDYWDGDRRYGYGGYRYDGRWKPVAERLIEIYDLKANSKILDVGCGKGFLLYELGKLLPGAELVGFDRSHHGIADSPKDSRATLSVGNAQDTPYKWGNQHFDLLLSLGCIHNLRLMELAKTLPEFQRVSKQAFVMLESYRNEKELFNLQCWALTCESFFDKEEWEWLYDHFGYQGDYEFIYFE